MYEHCAFVWKYSEAPKEFRELSDNGGDEDWVIYIPIAVWDSWQFFPRWIEMTDSTHEPQKIRFIDNTRDGYIFIGSHA